MIPGFNRGQQRRYLRDHARWARAVYMHLEFPQAFGAPRILPKPGGRFGKHVTSQRDHLAQAAAMQFEREMRGMKP